MKKISYVLLTLCFTLTMCCIGVYTADFTAQAASVIPAAATAIELGNDSTDFVNAFNGMTSDTIVKFTEDIEFASEFSAGVYDQTNPIHITVYTNGNTLRYRYKGYDHTSAPILLSRYYVSVREKCFRCIYRRR